MSGEQIRVLSYTNPDYEEAYFNGKIVAEGEKLEMKDFLDAITNYFGITTKLLEINSD
jgi:hypothetical protein